MHTLFQNVFFADATPAAGSPAAGPPGLLGSPFIMMGLMGVIFYFVLIRPQQKRAKELAKLVESIKSGDKVGTSSGIIGVVITVKDREVTLRSADSKLVVSKASITEILEAGNSPQS